MRRDIMTDTTAREDHAAEISRLLGDAAEALYGARAALDRAALLAPLDLYADGSSHNSSADLSAAVRVLTLGVARDSSVWTSIARARAMRHV
jgi:hypothetical protein